VLPHRVCCIQGAAFNSPNSSYILPKLLCQKHASLAQEVLLLEYDTRFSVVAGAGFIHYDLDEPLSFYRAETLQGCLDVVVVDPPFHSEASQMKVSSTIAHILRPGGRIVLLTGLMLSSLIDTIYSSPLLPKLHRRGILVEHDGVGRLATPYACWVGGGAESQDDSKFGEVYDDGEESR